MTATAASSAPSATAPRQSDPPRVSLRSPADLIALTPYLLGFHPRDSVVVVGLRERQIAFAARADLPDPAGIPARVQELVDPVARQRLDTVVLLGYGPAAVTDPVLSALREAVTRRGLRVAEMLRVDAGRWWSYLCENPRCCPPEGAPIDPARSEVSATCAYAGLTAAASRAELAGRVAPVAGPARAAMDRATGRADRALLDWLATLPEGERAEAVLAEGRSAVEGAIARHAEGGSLDDGALARLGLLLTWTPVRDAAWQAITSEQPHLRLWTDVTRRVEPALAPAPATLLAFTAWRAGDGALAGLALERALREDPSYSLAQLLLDALRQGIAPSMLDGWPRVGEAEPVAGEAEPVDGEAEPVAGDGQVTRSPPA